MASTACLRSTRFRQSSFSTTPEKSHIEHRASFLTTLLTPFPPQSQRLQRAPRNKNSRSCQDFQLRNRNKSSSLLTSGGLLQNHIAGGHNRVDMYSHGVRYPPGIATRQCRRHGNPAAARMFEHEPVALLQTVHGQRTT